jgi:hypothetical protein
MPKTGRAIAYPLLAVMLLLGAACTADPPAQEPRLSDYLEPGECLSSANGIDVMWFGPDDKVGNLKGFMSFDGSCSGVEQPPNGEFMMVFLDATNEHDAILSCGSIDEPDRVLMAAMISGQGYAGIDELPGNVWVCAYATPHSS